MPSFGAPICTKSKTSKKRRTPKIRESYLVHIPAGIKAVVELRVGDAAPEILNYAKEIDAELIVIGRQGTGGLSKTLFGNVTEKIARKAECPVLIIPYTFEKKMAHEEPPGLA